MPRSARTFGNSGYLHVIVRGIGRQLLFEEPSDYHYYIWLLEKYSGETGTAVNAYCLMENHVHLLVRHKEGSVSLFMKKMGISYSAYFNRKYERTGHLFQDRFKSEPVDDDAYFLSVNRYILKNPEKAGICSAADYPWSSYSLYFSKDTFVDTSLLHDMIGSESDYREFVAAENDAVCMESENDGTKEDRTREILRSVLGTENGMILQSFDSAERDEAITALHKAGLSVRTIERITGIGRGIIQKILW